MNFNVISFETSRGEKPVEEFIKSLNEGTIAKVMHVIDLLEMYGYCLTMPHTKKITTNLHELRIRGKEETRILYAFIDNNIYLLHGFKKKTQKIPNKEIAVAAERLGLLTLI